MTYRPYPNPDRARRQLARHHPTPTGIITLPHTLTEQQYTAFRAAFGEQAHATLEAAGRAAAPFIAALREAAANVKAPQIPPIR